MKHSVAQIAVIVAGAVALIGPARAEWSALQRIRAGASRCADGPQTLCGGLSRIDIDIEGLRLWHPWQERRGLHAEAEQVVVGANLDGLTVDVYGAALHRALAPSTEAARTEPKASDDSNAPTAEPASPPRRKPLSTYGVPVAVQVHGPATWSRDSVDLQLDAPSLRLDGHGNATAEFGLSVHGRGLDLDSDGSWTARTVEGDPRRWHATGGLRVGGGPTTRAELRTSPRAIEAQLVDDGGGQLWVSAPLSRATEGTDEVRVHAQGFSLANLGRTGGRTLDAWGVDARRAIVHGAARLTHRANARSGSIDIEEFSLSGLVIHQAKLARTPVQLDGLAAHGAFSWEGDAVDGSMWLAHRDAEVTLTGRIAPDAMAVRAKLAPLPCQALLNSVPTAMADMVAGTELQGTIDGYVDLAIDRVALLAAKAERKRPHDAPAPGSLELSFPFLERCTVIHDDPRLDMGALSGAYRHRFIDHDGRQHSRLMARGGPGYVALSEVPLLARAFVALEDRRFWAHDGFDREQINNAFWYNLIEGRVRRGASTISQQAARNLWLGIDRSWGRKLQEALLTARLEATTSKIRVMELYLNIIELGPGTHGVEDAAHLYFGKPASKLNALQAAHIAALAPAPNRFAAQFIDGHVDADWLDTLREHVRRMHRAGFITRAQMNTALHSRLRLLDRRR